MGSPHQIGITAGRIAAAHRIDVQLARQQGPALFIRRLPMPSGAPEARPTGGLSVQRPPHPRASTEFVLQTLMLPHIPAMQHEVHPIPGRHGLVHIWVPDEPTGLVLPSHVTEELQFERAWGIGLLATPRRIGFGGDTGALAQASWAVLAASSVDHVVRLTCGLAAMLDESPLLSEVMVPLALMAAPGALTGRLVAAARGGDVWLYGKCLRWIARERCVGGAAQVSPYVGGDAVPLLAAYFPTVCAGGPPTDADVIRACWFLHEAFMGPELPNSHDAVSAAPTIAAMTHGLVRAGGWMARLGHWDDVWRIGDEHPVGKKTWNGLTPSQLRGSAMTLLGMTVAEWFGAATAIAARSWLAYQEGLPQILTIDGGGRLPFVLSDDENIVLDLSAALDLVREHGSMTPSELALAIAADLDDRQFGYRGYGTLPQHEAHPLRSQPVLRLDDGTMVITDLGAFADWAANLPRQRAATMLETSRRRIGATLGLMFEAHAADILGRLQTRHTVITGPKLDGALGATGQRADALVANNDGIVVVECSLQTLSLGVASGDRETVDRLLTDYQRKATQARAVLSRMPDLSAKLDVPTARPSTYLLVTDVPLTYTPATAEALNAADPTGVTRFVCGIADLSLLVDLCERGWSFPAAVIAWQNASFDLPLRHHLDRMNALLGPATHSAFDALARMMRAAPRIDQTAA